MKDFGNVIIDAYRTYDTLNGYIIEGFVGQGDPLLSFIFNEKEEELHLSVSGKCQVSNMRETVKSVGHDLYLPFSKSLNPTKTILENVCKEYNIDNTFRPTSYSMPEAYVTGFVEVPEIVAKYGFIKASIPSFYCEPQSNKKYCSTHFHSFERLYLDWENPKPQHLQWQKTLWMKNEFHLGFRVKEFRESERQEMPINNETLDIRIPFAEVGRFSGLINKMILDRDPMKQ